MKDNKLIAEFMGMKPLNNDSSVLVFSTDRGNDIVSIDNLQYQDDWNLLMEVVEKIENIVWVELNESSFNVTIGATSYCVIQDNNGELVEIIGQGETKIESVYKAVVEFIKWYNNESNY